MGSNPAQAGTVIKIVRLAFRIAIVFFVGFACVLAKICNHPALFVHDLAILPGVCNSACACQPPIGPLRTSAYPLIIQALISPDALFAFQTTKIHFIYLTRRQKCRFVTVILRKMWKNLKISIKTEHVSVIHVLSSKPGQLNSVYSRACISSFQRSFTHNL